MEKILNSIEELYQLITDTLPEGYVEHNFRDPRYYKRYGVRVHPTSHFDIIHNYIDSEVKIEYGKAYKTIISGRIYKYV